MRAEKGSDHVQTTGTPILRNAGTNEETANPYTRPAFQNSCMSSCPSFGPAMQATTGRVLVPMCRHRHQQTKNTDQPSRKMNFMASSAMFTNMGWINGKKGFAESTKPFKIYSIKPSSKASVKRGTSVRQPFLNRINNSIQSSTRSHRICSF